MGGKWAMRSGVSLQAGFYIASRFKAKDGSMAIEIQQKLPTEREKNLTTAATWFDRFFPGAITIRCAKAMMESRI